MTDDEFDIDIYGDANAEPDGPPFKKDAEGDVKIEGTEQADGSFGEVNGTTNGIKHEAKEDDDDYVDIKIGLEDQQKTNGQHQQPIKSTDESGRGSVFIPRQAPQQ